MSYILDALRRLEQDKESARKVANPFEAVMNPDPLPAGPSGSKRLAWIGAGLVLLAVAVIGTYWVTLRISSGPSGNRSEILPANPLPSRVLPETRAPVSSAGRSPAASAPGLSEPVVFPATETSSPVQTVPVNEEPLGIPEYLDNPSSAATPAESVESFPSSEVSIPDSSGMESWTEREDPLPVSEDSEGTDPQEVVVHEVFHGGKWGEIKINAIAWSPEEESRFAVINLRTVYEGDHINGILVTEIHENGIIFDEDGLKTKVVLGRR